MTGLPSSHPSSPHIPSPHSPPANLISNPNPSRSAPSALIPHNSRFTIHSYNSHPTNLSSYQFINLSTCQPFSPTSTVPLSLSSSSSSFLHSHNTLKFNQPRWFLTMFGKHTFLPALILFLSHSLSALGIALTNANYDGISTGTPFNIEWSGDKTVSRILLPLPFFVK